MATGIVAADARSLHLTVTFTALSVLAAGAYLLLVASTLWRIIAVPTQVRAELTDPQRGFGAFTFVAGINVLGTLLVGERYRVMAVVMLAIGAVSWVVLGYAVPCLVLLTTTYRRSRPRPTGRGFSGPVGAHSVAVLAASIEPTTAAARPELALLAVASWSTGLVLYAGVSLAVAAALVRRKPNPAQFAPPYWIAMGATAITAVAGARIADMDRAPAVDATRSLVAAVSVVALAFGTWLIPLLLAAGWWRHVRHRIALRYQTAWWSIVFPVGMYSVALHDLGIADRLPLAVTAGQTAGWCGLTTWVVTFAAMVG